MPTNFKSSYHDQLDGTGKHEQGVASGRPTYFQTKPISKWFGFERVDTLSFQPSTAKHSHRRHHACLRQAFMPQLAISSPDVLANHTCTQPHRRNNTPTLSWENFPARFAICKAPLLVTPRIWCRSNTDLYDSYIHEMSCGHLHEMISKSAHLFGWFFCPSDGHQ